MKLLKYCTFALRSLVMLPIAIVAMVPTSGVSSTLEPQAAPVSDTVPHFRSGGGGYYTPGLLFPNIGDASHALESAGLPSLGSIRLFNGGGGHGYINNFLIGGMGGGVSGGEHSVGAVKITWGGGFGVGYLGYDVLPKLHRLNLYPIVGMGGGGIGMQISTTTPITFDQLLTSSSGARTESSVGTGGLLGLAAVGLEYFVGRGWHSGDALGGFILGLRAGYLFAPTWGGMWQLDGPGSTKTNFSLGGPVLMLTIGGGGAQWLPRGERLHESEP